MPLRIYLTGRMCIESGELLLDERQFGGRQCRVALAYLICERDRPVPRSELADVLWPEAMPRAWETAISALVSRMRRMFRDLPPAGACSILSSSGCYELRLPGGTWIDLEAGTAAIHEAESALRYGTPKQAWGPANVAATIARRPFLPGQDGAWVDRQRGKLHAQLVRALDSLSDVWSANGEFALAVQAATEAVALEPFRETSWNRLMRAHAATGNRAEALRAFEQCRALLTEELGTEPSPETEAVYLELLRSS